MPANEAGRAKQSWVEKWWREGGEARAMIKMGGGGIHSRQHGIAASMPPFIRLTPVKGTGSRRSIASQGAPGKVRETIFLYLSQTSQSIPPPPCRGCNANLVGTLASVQEGESAWADSVVEL